ncbi:MAG: hypothetical protein A3G75_04760, partial [Verrucomicrobia bacterium RIFCSPLOWO2_12_FULL_64_8]
MNSAMSSSAWFRRLLPLVAVAAMGLLPARLGADLVWTPEAGWKLEGGVLSGLAGEESRNALELMNKARFAEEKGNYGTALGAYKKVTKNYPQSIYAPEAYYRTAYIRLARHQYDKAFMAFQEIVMRYPNTPKFNQVVAEQYRIATAVYDGARNRIWGVIPLSKNRERSVGFYEQILSNAPYSDQAPAALMSIARAHQRFGNTPEAIDALDRMINFYPQSLLTPDAYLRLAQTHASLVEGPYYDQASTHEAITYYQDFMILFPGDPNIATAEKGLSQMKQELADSKMKMADYYFKYRQNYKAAKVFYNEAITVYPDSKVAERARTQLAVIDQKLAAQPAETPAAGTAPATVPPAKVEPKR